MKARCPICNKVRRIRKRKELTPVTNCHSCATKLWWGGGHKDNLKKCTICKQWQPLVNFSKNSLKWDNLEAFCRHCNTIKMRSYRERNREKVNLIAYKSMSNHPKECNARSLSNYYYPKRQVCSLDGCNQMGERHHPDYSNPSLIIWLCPKHHRELHNQTNNVNIP